MKGHASGVLVKPFQPPVILQATRQRQAMLPREFTHHGPEFLPVMGHMHGLHFFMIDAGPDHMSMLAPVLHMKHDRAGLVGKPHFLFDAGDKIQILLTG